MDTGCRAQNMYNACQADWFLLDPKKEKFSCPVFVMESNLLLKELEPMCTAASVHWNRLT
jgi:hypothetical protein